jgi:TatD DNase family protein
MLASDKGQSLVGRMPRDRVLTESDGPFAQVNGETVMPWHVERTICDLAHIWSLSPAEVEELLHANLRSLLSAASLTGIEQQCLLADEKL